MAVLKNCLLALVIFTLKALQKPTLLKGILLHKLRTKKKKNATQKTQLKIQFEVKLEHCFTLVFDIHF